MKDEIEERMLEASLEVELGGAAAEDLTRRILAAHRRENPSASAAPGAPARSRARRVAPRRGRLARRPRSRSGRRWLLGLAALAAAVLLMLWWVGSGADPAEPPQQARPTPEQRPGGVELAGGQEPGPNPEVEPRPGPELGPGPAVEPGPEPGPGVEPGPEVEPGPVEPVPVVEPGPAVEPGPELGPGPEPGPPPIPVPEPLPEAVAAEGTVDDGPAARVAVAGRGLRVRVAGGSWQDLEAGAAVALDSELKCREPTTLELGAAVVVFDGELRLAQADGGLELEVLDDAFYADNLAADAPLAIRAGEQLAQLDDGTLYLEKSGSTVLFACLAGEVALDGLTLGAGLACKARRQRLGEPEPFDAAALAGEAALFGAVPTRSLWLEDFTLRPAGWEAGEVRDGVASCEGDGASIQFDLDVPAEVLPGMVIRLRLRASGVDQLVFQTLEHDESRNYRLEIRELPGSFTAIDIPCAELYATVERDALLPAGARLRNLQLHIYGADARLELDRVVFLRSRP